MFFAALSFCLYMYSCICLMPGDGRLWVEQECSPVSRSVIIGHCCQVLYLRGVISETLKEEEIDLPFHYPRANCILPFYSVIHCIPLCTPLSVKAVTLIHNLALICSVNVILGNDREFAFLQLCTWWCIYQTWLLLTP